MGKQFMRALTGTSTSPNKVMTLIAKWVCCGPFKPFYTILDKTVFCPKNTTCVLALELWGEKSFLSEMVLKGPDGPKRV